MRDYTMQDADPVWGFFEDRCLVPGSRSRVPGTWDPGPDQRRGPNTEDRKRAHGVCRV